MVEVLGAVALLALPRCEDAAAASGDDEMVSEFAGEFGAACMGLAAIARVPVPLGISAIARPLRAHAMRARVHAWIATVSTIDDWAQVLDAVGAVSVANLPSGRLAALCDHPGWVPSKLSVWFSPKRQRWWRRALTGVGVVLSCLACE